MSSSSQYSQAFHWHFTALDDDNFEIQGRTLFLVVVLFSVILLFTLLYLYARWVCRYRHPFPHALPPPPPPRSRGLDPLTIKTLPIALHRSSEAPNSREQAECCICLGVFEDGDKVKVLPLCRHCYHPECVDRWLSVHSSCPLCRGSLRINNTPVGSAIPHIVVE
ncbi:RING-H2 finger protein ATL66 [Alnus glutinosa]|uniref:RING-H2 finger protein ATL66 n=1 Tax=Alnus glutinosa TaxID=3517 RepID=UPI002D771945|nr:RING-H2 finger protein ATL66 [Alnus glutinosa]